MFIDAYTCACVRYFVHIPIRRHRPQVGSRANPMQELIAHCIAFLLPAPYGDYTDQYIGVSHSIRGSLSTNQYKNRTQGFGHCSPSTSDKYAWEETNAKAQ